MKRIQVKKHKIGIYLYHVLITKDVLDNGVNTLAYFHKDCNEKCDKNKNKDQ